MKGGAGDILPSCFIKTLRQRFNFFHPQSFISHHHIDIESLATPKVSCCLAWVHIFCQSKTHQLTT